LQSLGPGGMARCESEVHWASSLQQNPAVARLALRVSAGSVGNTALGSGTPLWDQVLPHSRQRAWLLGPWKNVCSMISSFIPADCGPQVTREWDFQNRGSSVMSCDGV
jgi:hypothetical protein